MRLSKFSAKTIIGLSPDSIWFEKIWSFFDNIQQDSILDFSFWVCWRMSSIHWGFRLFLQRVVRPLDLIDMRFMLFYSHMMVWCWCDWKLALVVLKLHRTSLSDMHNFMLDSTDRDLRHKGSFSYYCAYNSYSTVIWLSKPLTDG